MERRGFRCEAFTREGISGYMVSVCILRRRRSRSRRRGGRSACGPEPLHEADGPKPPTTTAWKAASVQPRRLRRGVHLPRPGRPRQCSLGACDEECTNPQGAGVGALPGPGVRPVGAKPARIPDPSPSPVHTTNRTVSNRLWPRSAPRDFHHELLACRPCPNFRSRTSASGS